ncbi:hypothetical protein NBRC10512_007078 [Rhodotorula toruloides]|uniref:RHTO0S16e03620g1_1 n=2 Tax=Rhodotorula toruloides TaxID=5286 RepID=A0A061BFS9_RHOTO|nr:uncharacterized protein RHTO_02315 [Rhodotorula toruloides NP11]EMS21057.1 hypothetical protein RHTO_02315 [Rhodotorula toruloides NP11]CDR48210.1 RHTO0S16e03620g1_1 [Rhodotorula toruloides]
MRPTARLMGGGAQYPYPKEVWTPAGGWWTNPHNWRTNTAYAMLGIAFVGYGIFKFSAEHEERHTAPTRWIPSMMWAKQFKNGEMGIKDESDLRGQPTSHH